MGSGLRQKAELEVSVDDLDWWPNDNPDKEYWLTALVTRIGAGPDAEMSLVR